MMIVAIGLIGTGGMQLASTRYQQTSYMRGQGIVQAQFIVEKMRANSSAIGTYLTNDAYATATLAALPADPACGMTASSTCTAAQSAAKDLRDWRRALQAMPGGRGSINSVTAGGVTDTFARQVIVMWQEKQQNEVGTSGTPDPTAEEDASCPAPRVAGVRCLTMTITP
ncbi:MAG: type IV pilus modification protein PilV [Rhodoferax sp.]|nr:type IV pilus modification protein PilV [Rhodoferax sp.]